MFIMRVRGLGRSLDVFDGVMWFDASVAWRGVVGVRSEYEYEGGVEE